MGFNMTVCYRQLWKSLQFAGIHTLPTKITMQITSFWEQLPGCEALAEEAPAAPRCCRRWQPAAAAAALARQARVAARSNGQITEELVGFICLTVNSWFSAFEMWNEAEPWWPGGTLDTVQQSGARESRAREWGRWYGCHVKNRILTPWNC